MLQNINQQVRAEVHFNQWKNTTDVIKWYNERKDKYSKFEMKEREKVGGQCLTLSCHYINIEEYGYNNKDTDFVYQVSTSQ